MPFLRDSGILEAPTFGNPLLLRNIEIYKPYLTFSPDGKKHCVKRG